MRIARAVRRLLIVTVATAVVSVSAVMPARADDLADEADLQFQLGAERYEVGDYKGALEHFLASNRLVPNKNVLFNIARTYEQLRRAPDAYRYYVLSLEGEQSPQAKKRIEDSLARITPNVAILKVETDPPGATVYLDRKDLGPRGNSPRVLGLAEGKHRVIAEKAGYEPAESEPLDLRIGKEITVSLRLKQVLGTAKLEGAPGAQVKVDDEAGPVACALPCTLELTPGRHTFFVLKEGFQSGEISADVPANEVTTVRMRLATQTGAVVVASDVRDALIEIDGSPVGFTPSVLAVPVGKHTIKVSQEGYRPLVRDIEVSTKQEVKVDAQLAFVEEVSAASRTTESVEDAPASVTIISRQELRAMGYPTLASALRGIRGLYLSDDTAYSSIGFRAFSSPGSYGNRVLVLLDGHPMNDDYIWSSYVGTDARVDIDDVERIEIVRGPGSVLYGSSAFFGVINLVTRSRNQPTHSEVAVGTFGHGLGRARATTVVRFSPEAGFWATVSGLQGGGQREMYFSEYDLDPTTPDVERKANGLAADGVTRGTDGQFAGMITGRVWWRSLTLQWFLNSRRKSLPAGQYDTIFDDGRTTFLDTRGLIEARFEPHVTKTLQSLSRAHVDMYNFGGVLAYRPVDGGVEKDTYRGRWGGLEQRFVYTPSSALRLTVGGQLVRHFKTLQLGMNEAGSLLFDDAGNNGRDDPFTVGAGYVNADVQAAPRVKISAGARLDYYSNLSKFEVLPATNPRLAVIFKPYEGGVLKVMGAKAFRSPSVYELFYTARTQIAAAKLSPEQIYSGEVELSHRFSQNVVGSVAGYTNFVEDLIVLADVGPALVQYQNAPNGVRIIGGEAEVRREWHQGWMLAANYSYQNASYTGGGLREVPNSVEHLASVKGAVPIIGRALMGMSRVTVEGPRPDRYDRPGDPPQGHTDTGVVWDLVLSGEVERMGLRYNLGVYNAMDWRYAAIPSSEFRQRQIVQSGRTFLASATVSF